MAQSGRLWQGSRSAFYEEMHVDSGTTAEVVLYETALKPLTQVIEANEQLHGRRRYP